jgi:hypothetical protein
MHARLVTITGTDVDAAVRFLDEKVVPVASQQKGFRQVAASGDRSRGLVNIISVWESKGDLEASDSAIGKLRQEGLGLFGGQATVSAFEQVVWEIAATPPQPGCSLRLVTYNTDPSRVEDNIAWFKSDVAPAIMATPGIRAVRNLVNRETGEGRVGTVFSDRPSLDAAADTRARLMAAARERGIEFGEDTILEVLYGRMAPS